MIFGFAGASYTPAIWRIVPATACQLLRRLAGIYPGHVLDSGRLSELMATEAVFSWTQSARGPWQIVIRVRAWRHAKFE